MTLACFLAAFVSGRSTHLFGNTQYNNDINGSNIMSTIDVLPNFDKAGQSETFQKSGIDSCLVLWCCGVRRRLNRQSILPWNTSVLALNSFIGKVSNSLTSSVGSSVPSVEDKIFSFSEYDVVWLPSLACNWIKTTWLTKEEATAMYRWLIFQKRKNCASSKGLKQKTWYCCS